MLNAHHNQYLISSKKKKKNITCPFPHQGFPGGSDGKESASSGGDAGWIPGSGRPPEEAVGTHSGILAQGQRSPAGCSPQGHSEMRLRKSTALPCAQGPGNATKTGHSL